MANICESSFMYRDCKQAKDADKPELKSEWSSNGVVCSSLRRCCTTGIEKEPKLFCQNSATG